MKIALLPNLTKTNAVEYTVKAAEKFIEMQSEIFMLNSDIRSTGCTKAFGFSSIEQLVKACDIIVTIGGDGTIIHSSKQAVLFDKPILGINLGRIGFVAGLERYELDKLENIAAGNYKIENRAMLEIEVEKEKGRENFFALNDVVVSRDTLSKIIDFSISLGENETCRYRADGIIFSTPTGSTAYSLSAGGPIIEPTMRCILVTPICAHSIGVRPIIFGGDSKISVSAVSHKDSRAYLTIDGEKSINISSNQKVKIRLSEKSVKIMNMKNKNFYKTLNKKLGLSKELDEKNL